MASGPGAPRVAVRPVTGEDLCPRAPVRVEQTMLYPDGADGNPVPGYQFSRRPGLPKAASWRYAPCCQVSVAISHGKSPRTVSVYPGSAADLGPRAMSGARALRARGGEHHPLVQLSGFTARHHVGESPAADVWQCTTSGNAAHVSMGATGGFPGFDHGEAISLAWLPIPLLGARLAAEFRIGNIEHGNSAFYPTPTAFMDRVDMIHAQLAGDAAFSWFPRAGDAFLSAAGELSARAYAEAIGQGRLPIGDGISVKHDLDYHAFVGVFTPELMQVVGDAMTQLMGTDDKAAIGRAALFADVLTGQLLHHLRDTRNELPSAATMWARAQASTRAFARETGVDTESLLDALRAARQVFPERVEALRERLHPYAATVN